MLIKVCRSGRRSRSVSVPDNATVSTLKEAIEAQEKIPYKEQTLTFNGLILEDDKLISDYGIVEHCTVLLYLRLGFQPDFLLTVVLPSKMRINLDISGENTVADLKKHIEDKVSFSVANVELIYNHWILEDDRKLTEYGITGGAEVIVTRELNAESSLESRDSTQAKHTHSITLSSHRKKSEKFSDGSGGEGNESGDDENHSDFITVIFLPKSGSPISLGVHPNTPIGRVRGRLAQILQEPSNALWFVRDGKQLNPSKTFAQYGISHGESVCLLSDGHVADTSWTRNSFEEKNGEAKIRVIIQRKNGNPLACHVRRSATVGALKRGLEKEIGVSQSRMDLFYQQKMLSDDALLKDYDLTDGVVVYLQY